MQICVVVTIIVSTHTRAPSDLPQLWWYSSPIDDGQWCRVQNQIE